jgi:hypothetical protein
MAEAKDKNETFKNILLELMVSNETLDKINMNTLNASEMGLEAAANLESLIANQSPGNSNGPDGSPSSTELLSERMISILDLIARYSHRTVVALDAISQIMSDTFNLNRSEALKNEEDRREGEKNKKPGVASIETPEMESGFGIMGTIAAIAGLVIGFVSGVVSSLVKTFTAVMTAIGKFLKIDVLLAKIGITPEKIKGLFKPISTFFTQISENITKAIQAVKTSITNSKFFQSVKNFFKPLQPLFAFFTKEGSILSKISGMFGKVTAFFGKLGSIFKSFLKFGLIFGKLAGPIGIAISAISSIFDGLKIFKETGDIGKALEVGVVGFINAFTGNMFDLLKSAVSWIAGALGFKDVEKFLDSFSFTDIIAEFFHRFIKAGREMFEQYFQNFVDIFDDISKKFGEGNIIGGIIEIFRGLLKTIATNVLDIPKNLIASVAEGLGFNSIAKSMRDFSFSGLFGGTHTKTGGETQTDTKSVIGAAGDTTAKKAAAKAADKAADKVKAAQDGESDNTLLKLFGSDPFGDFNTALLENYNRTTNPAGAAITPAPVEAIGALIAATSADTANIAQDAAGRAASPIVAPGANTKTSTVNNSNFTIQQSNLPDKTAHSLRSSWLF